MTLAGKYLYTTLLFLILVLLGCQTVDDKKKYFLKVKGYAQGSTYSITYSDHYQRDFSYSIDSILNIVDSQLSTYDSNSFISLLNKSKDTCLSLHGKSMFTYCFNISKEINNKTNGFFNPAVYPLVNYWGFYSDSTPSIDSLFIKDSLLNYIDLNNNFSLFKDSLTTYICKKSKNSKLDFNAVAQGYSVDLVSDFLKTKRVENFLIEIGGELSSYGKNHENKLWRVGIERPIDSSFVGEFEFQKIIELDNQSLATSGNYRKFKVINGRKFSHSIDPISGFPANNNLLSVTVICEKAASADALATSFMVMGKEKAIDFIASNPLDSIFCFMVYDSAKSLKEWSNF
ncbi:MAG: FAD:protein FMN transferase [Flavobacteriales bacterium]|nr:FAD:protein FMN transferase [Flavobacteriales bacterium]